ncbi:PAS domain S-box protein [Thermodesulfobacteriota bacterium]
MEEEKSKSEKAKSMRDIARYRDLFDESLDPMYITTREGRFIDANKALLKLFGYTKAELINNINVEQIYAYPGDRTKFQEKIEQDGSVKSYNVKFRKKNRTEMDCLLTGTVRQTKNGKILGYQGIIRDVSEIIRSERIRNDVYRMMRHDLKTPIIGIRGLVGLLLKNNKLTGKQHKTAEMIQDLSERMLGFIDRARDLFQMEEGTYRLNPSEVNILGIIRRIKKTLGDIASAKQIAFSFTLFGQETNLKDEYIILGEEALLEIMLANLIKNAIEASPQGGPISISITTDSSKCQTFHLIDIHNVGTIPMDIRERFFEPYTTSGKKSGTGLGTHSALLVVRAHKGDINFTTSKKEGTHLLVRLPANTVSTKPWPMEKTSGLLIK